MKSACRTLALLLAFGLTSALGNVAIAQEITVYSGRSKSFMDHLFNAFEKDTGIKVNRVYDKTAAIALKLKTEGERSPADVVLAQDAGALGSLSDAGLLAPLPESITARVDPTYVSEEGDWVATSLRGRTLAYSSARVDENDLPASVYDLTDPKYQGRVGFAPGNASFQAFVTAMRLSEGEEKTKQWLLDMKANGVKSFPKNTAIIQGIAAGEIDFGLPNHYYLIRFKISDSKFPVEQTNFEQGDIGNMVNVAGAGVLKSSKNAEAAQKLIDYLLTDKGQHYFVGEIFEYPVVDGVMPHRQHGDLDTKLEQAPEVDLNAISDLNGTLKLLREVGLL
ncbi:iron ABC transporter substrate-binding protein [Algisphaera agarilytica]|uniref:Iron(III) transport system substrate-binding protein n=1 Tax=Algisphaera agarilytica TaxID=1385975 RepID=A0A7X0H9B8_9BACT|nr:iron ABC transporter substrate-binding protein [Algisphaera agarilytica]MBB6431606.1 iron(III) transport system substrate-binding protein [Algisphaera agarilytica]